MTPEIFLRDGFGDHPRFNGIILEESGKSIGYLLYCFGYNTYLATRTVQIVDLFVTRDEQRRGFGTVLMRALVPICKIAGIHVVCVSVWGVNVGAKQFYRSLGAESTNEELFLLTAQALTPPT